MPVLFSSLKILVNSSYLEDSISDLTSEFVML